MKSHNRVSIVGGILAGRSVSSHPAKPGGSNVCLIERSVPIAGLALHAAGDAICA